MTAILKVMDILLLGRLDICFNSTMQRIMIPRWQGRVFENFPFIPSGFRYKVKSAPRNRGKEDSGAKKQLKIIYLLMKRNDVDMIISACDIERFII